MASRPFVVGLSGVPGSGKTTLTQLLARQSPQHRVVYYDQFQTITNMTHDQVRAWFSRGGDPNEFPLTELVAELTRRTQIEPGAQLQPVVLFETPIGRLHRATGAFIDFLIWVDTPLDVALARATLAFLGLAENNRSPNAASDFLKWQTQYMINYPLIRPMYVAQRERIMANAELVLDGNKPVADSADAVRKALAAHGVQF
jgi:hypothetical protein